MGCKLKDIKGVHAPSQVLEGNDLVGLLYEDCGGELFSNYFSSFCARLAVEPANAIPDFLNIAINRMFYPRKHAENSILQALHKAYLSYTLVNMYIFLEKQQQLAFVLLSHLVQLPIYWKRFTTKE